MKNRKDNISSMQVEVWKMKDRVYKETKKMNSTEFFDYIKNKSKKLITVKNKSATP